MLTFICCADQGSTDAALTHDEMPSDNHISPSSSISHEESTADLTDTALTHFDMSNDDGISPCFSTSHSRGTEMTDPIENSWTRLVNICSQVYSMLVFR